MHPVQEHQLRQTRRYFLGRTAAGMGAAALATLGGEPIAQAATTSDQVPDYLARLAPKAKRVIYLFMAGAPSQMDTLDYKPAMDEMFDKDLPESVIQGQRFTTMTSGQKRFPVAPSMYKFAQYGQHGAWVSELLPHTAKIVDEISILRSVHTEAINHDPAITFIQTGSQLPGRPSLGAWLSYGLGSLNANLPSFVVMTPTWSAKRDAQALFSRLWGSGFLPSKHQGVSLRAQGDPVLYLSDPPGVSREARRRMLDGLAELNGQQLSLVGDPEIETRTAQYEMAFRMQTSVPELVDFSDEPQHIMDMYGPDVQKPGTFAASCLLARRMAERDVRFVQIFHRGWDHHGSLPRDLPLQCRDVDQPSAALVNDLKQRGMLDDTLVVWGGEFGRTIYCQGRLTRTNYGRDHHPRCFSIWMAGGGARTGVVHGETDDFSYNIVSDPVHINDLNATILHCLGIDHEKLTFKFQGLDVRLTGVEPARVVSEVLR
ncbi:MAG: DUF1501 domain-containing protein [Planctomycetota bacterium]|nr:MAG: DUF1501 domain-containing protein [Planctomycetota bacterium]REJ94060.1 MAG: DUF1501 domain-containing protein [Planctomycetota bacterium]REK17878.1 MAG: DUF1501 domain-containing protein [Planctomycetota bacterium]REK42418.1 MAG: DUF1501 domain-containing protein [Planctomycetota bacterium]